MSGAGSRAFCYVCGAAGRQLGAYAHSITSESRPIPGPSSLHLCDRCGHVFTRADLDVDTYYQQYDAKLTDEGMDEIVTAPDGRIVFRTELDYGLMRQHIDPFVDTDASIFEYGAGRGRILSRLFKDGYRDLHAYEVSGLYRDALARFVPAEALSIGVRPAAPRPFDLACSFFVLEHDAAPFESLRYLKSVLREGGHLYLMLPNYRTNVVDLACADHLNHFSDTYLAVLVRACGFDVLVCDERSNVGATIILGRSDGQPVRDGALPPASAAMVESSAATVRPFIGYMERLQRLSERLQRGRRLFFYGAGFYSAIVHAHVKPAGFDPAGIFDANPRKQGTTHLGAPVASPDLIASGDYRDADLVICVNPTISELIRDKYAEFFHGAVII